MVSNVLVRVHLPPSWVSPIVSAHPGRCVGAIVREACCAASRTTSGRLLLAAPELSAVEDLRTAGNALNRVLAGLGRDADARVFEGFVRSCVGVFGRVGEAAVLVRVPRCGGGGVLLPDRGEHAKDWVAVSVHESGDEVAHWREVSRVCGFRGVSAWARDSVAGFAGLETVRMRPGVTVRGESVLNRVLILLGQVERRSDAFMGLDVAGLGEFELGLKNARVCVESSLDLLRLYGDRGLV